MGHSREICPNQNQDCKYFPDCFADTHHDWYPRTEYRTHLEKQFRSSFVRLLCRAEHDIIHANGIPVKPSPEIMTEMLAGRHG